MEVKVPEPLYDRLSPVRLLEASSATATGRSRPTCSSMPRSARLLRAQGVQFVKTLETPTRPTGAWPSATRPLAREAARRSSPETGAAAPRAKSAIPLPGEVVIQRAYTFTNYAGRFLYVEAHTKAATPDATGDSPTMMLSFAGADGVFGAATEMPILRDTQTCITAATPYMYHRHLVRVTTVEPKTVRVASSAGGVDEAPVTEWVGTTRPPHAAGYLRGFFTRYMDPTEITDRFVSLAGEFSNLAEIVNLPNLTHGYRRKAHDGDGRQPRRAVRRPDRQLQRRRRPAGGDPRVAGLRATRAATTCSPRSATPARRTRR